LAHPEKLRDMREELESIRKFLTSSADPLQQAAAVIAADLADARS
jgi:hypothetical protein